MDKLDFLVSVASSLFEILAISIFLYEREKFCKKYNARYIVLIITTLLITVILNEIFKTKFSGVVYIFFVITYSKMFNYNFFKSFIKFIGGALLIMALQLIILYVVESFYYVDAVDNHYYYFFIAFSTMISSIAIKATLDKVIKKFNFFLDSVDEKILRYLDYKCCYLYFSL